MRFFLTLLLIAVLLTGCARAQQTFQVESAADTEKRELDTTEPFSIDTLMEKAAERERMPGRVHYERVCAHCHNGTVKKAPEKILLALMSPESILRVISEGIMQPMASGLSDSEHREIAEYLSGQPMGQEQADIPRCEGGQDFDASKPLLASNWGFTHGSRYIDPETAGITAEQFSQLKPRWAVSFPGANRLRSQPALAGGLLFVGSHNGSVYALDQESGCRVWAYAAVGEVRTGIVVRPWQKGEDSTQIYFGDVLGYIYAVDASTGAQRWRMRPEAHPQATITGTPALWQNTLYVPVSSLETGPALNPSYECCTFRGSVVAVDASDGSPLWRTYTIAQQPVFQKKNGVGTNNYGPSGAAVWSSPTLDPTRNQLYFGTSENYSSPATTTSDAVFAVDMDSGAVNWVFQGTANDAWNAACESRDARHNCPEEEGPDFDFAAPPVLISGPKNDAILVAGQKSGQVHGLDPDTGELVWKTRVGRGGVTSGGIHFGMAASRATVFVPVSDKLDGRSYEIPPQSGMHAVDAHTGEVRWSNVHNDNCAGRLYCSPGISQAVTAIGNVVVGGASDGVVRAYNKKSGRVIWQLDTTHTFNTVLGADTTGGSFGGGAAPVALNSKLVLSSGYGIYNNMRGNLLLVLELPDQDSVQNN